MRHTYKDTWTSRRCRLRLFALPYEPPNVLHGHNWSKVAKLLGIEYNTNTRGYNGGKRYWKPMWSWAKYWQPPTSRNAISQDGNNSIGQHEFRTQFEDIGCSKFDDGPQGWVFNILAFAHEVSMAMETQDLLVEHPSATEWGVRATSVRTMCWMFFG